LAEEIRIVIPKALKARLEKKAKEMNVTINDLIVLALSKVVEE
jgi:antitoxin component of RelBE/YafQ-DinJ toxin-antitoxin module